MKTSEVISKLVELDRIERPAYVILVTRDKDGMVICRQRFPVVSVYTHAGDMTQICIEQADCVDEFI